MKVYRGPKLKRFADDAHQFVSQIKPEALEKGIETQALIRFNITKDGIEREAVCTARFEEADLIPMMRGLLSRLTRHQDCLSKIKEVMGDKSKTNDQKIAAIQTALSQI